MPKCIIYAIINPTNPSCWFTDYSKRNHDNMLWDSDTGKELTGNCIRPGNGTPKDRFANL